MRLNRAQIQVFSISFLDVLSCALGAIIILSLASVLSNFWKISLHMLGVGGILGVFIAIHILYQNTNTLIIIFVWDIRLLPYIYSTYMGNKVAEFHMISL